MSKPPSNKPPPVQRTQRKSTPPSPRVWSEDKPLRGLPPARKEVLAVAFVALLALIIRAILIPAQGHVADMATFESWMGKLVEVGPKAFYAVPGAGSYPPGYVLILWVVGAIYHATFAHGDLSGNAMRVFVKLPPVISDIGIGYIVYLIARRSWPVAGAIVAMAVFALNPASWLVSAYWGREDSVAALFLVWAIYLAVTGRYAFAWSSLALAAVIQPQTLITAPFLLVWQAMQQGITWRLAAAPLMLPAVAYGVAVIFAPTGEIAGVLAWLLERFRAGIADSPYNSFNAMNLYSINRDFFQPDTQWITFMSFNLGPQFAWGIGIFIALAAAAGWRLWRVLRSSVDDDVRELTFYTACFIVMLGSYMLLTRQHERYLFSALALAPLLWNGAPVMRAATIVLSATFSCNLFYSLRYLAAPSADLNPPLVHLISFVNFATLVLVAGSYLIDEMGEWANARLSRGAPAGASEGSPVRARRSGPNPFEGLVSWAPRDYAIAGGLTAFTAVMLFWNITTPKDRYFDEIYYARAAQEYLHHQGLYEWTHPPLAKLIAAGGAWLFGMFGYGDPYGARMANAVMGTLTVPLLYAFAKRLFSSTAAAVVAAVLLLSSGYFYVQSRIATPEISVAFFALLTLYCFYRYWTSAQIALVTEKIRYPRIEKAAAALAIIFALLVLIFAQVSFYNRQMWPAVWLPYAAAVLLFGAAVSVGAWRWYRARAESNTAIYPDGTAFEGGNVVFPSGDVRPLRNAALVDGDATVKWTAEGVETVEGGDRIVWRPDGSIDGVIGGSPVKDPQLWGLWLAFSAVALASFISSKWDGLFGLVALWFVATAVFAQQFLRFVWKRPSAKSDAPRRFSWGNPIGIRLPIYLAATIFGILVVYVLTYVPNWTGAISTGTSTIGVGGFAGLLSLQYQMYHYHATLNATHLYSSKWWTWPFELRPVSYYYTTVSGTTPPNEVVAEILGVPNPAVWLAAVVSVPWSAYVAWHERHKGIMLLVVAYFAQWLPWALSPRIDFLYNSYPNLAVICLCSTYVIVHLWRRGPAESATWVPRAAALAYVAACIGLFVYFLPIWDAAHISWTAWYYRMLLHTGAPIGWI